MRRRDELILHARNRTFLCRTWLRTLALGSCAVVLLSMNTAGASAATAADPNAAGCRAARASGNRSALRRSIYHSAGPGHAGRSAASRDSAGRRARTIAVSLHARATARGHASANHASSDHDAHRNAAGRTASGAPKTASRREPRPDARHQQVFYRLDADAGTKPIALADLKKNRVYYAFNPRVGRYAWSIYLGNGQFWHAFAVGSIQPVRLFDLEMTLAEGLDRLRRVDPYLAKMASTTGEPIFVRLNNEGRWRLIERRPSRASSTPKRGSNGKPNSAAISPSCGCRTSAASAGRTD